jgi:hypothetical protein
MVRLPPMKLSEKGRDRHQLDLFDAFGGRMLGSAQMLRELQLRGASEVRSVRFKQNRLRLVSVSSDGAVLHVHACYAQAPPDVLDAIARFLSSDRGSPEFRRAISHLREWPGAREGLRQAQARSGNGLPAAAPCCGTPAQQQFLRALYDRLNRARFSGRLPADIPLRFSDRMSRRYGHVHYYRDDDGKRHVTELALNVRLLAKSNETHLLDTMLHEMAHAEAWLFHGHRQHGATWKRICLRVGCVPRACIHAYPRRVPLPVERVPRLPER